MPALKMSGIIKLDNVPEPFLRLAGVLRGLFAAVPVLRRVVFCTAIFLSNELGMLNNELKPLMFITRFIFIVYHSAFIILKNLRVVILLISHRRVA